MTCLCVCQKSDDSRIESRLVTDTDEIRWQLFVSLISVNRVQRIVQSLSLSVFELPDSSPSMVVSELAENLMNL